MAGKASKAQDPFTNVVDEAQQLNPYTSDPVLQDAVEETAAHLLMVQIHNVADIQKRFDVPRKKIVSVLIFKSFLFQRFIKSTVNILTFPDADICRSSLFTHSFA